MFKLDMHSHTRGSDGTGSVDQIVEAALNAGLDGLCLTDHHANTPEDNAEVHRVAQALEEAGVKAFIGVEYSTKQGHLLIFGIDVPREAWGRYPEMQEVIDDVNEMGGACVAAHPYKGYKYSLQDNVKTIRGLAAIEGYNGQVEVKTPRLNEKARAAAEEVGLPITGGSDAHFPRYTGVVYTEFQRELEDDADLVAALHEGAFTARRNEALIEAEFSFQKSRASRWQRESAQRELPLPPLPPVSAYEPEVERELNDNPFAWSE